VGPFYEEVHLCEMREPKPQYIAVVVDENKIKIEQYSARKPSKLEENINLSDECKNIYYLCKNKKVFALRNDAIILLLNIPKELLGNKDIKDFEWKGILKEYFVDSEENH
jgi:hypothetical protein